MLLAVNAWTIVLPLLVAQYILAVFSLTRLAYCNFPMRKYVIWNIVIMIVFFIGSFVFLTYYFVNKKRLTARPPEAAQVIIIDAPTGENNSENMAEKEPTGENNSENMAENESTCENAHENSVENAPPELAGKKQ